MEASPPKVVSPSAREQLCNFSKRGAVELIGATCGTHFDELIAVDGVDGVDAHRPDLLAEAGEHTEVPASDLDAIPGAVVSRGPGSVTYETRRQSRPRRHFFRAGRRSEHRDQWNDFRRDQVASAIPCRRALACVREVDGDDSGTAPGSRAGVAAPWPGPPVTRWR